MSVVVPFFDSCDLPPVLYGTGALYIVQGSNLIDVGNVSLADFSEEAEARRIFRGLSEDASVVVATAAYRAQFTGDSFSMDQLGRHLNEDVAANAEGFEIDLRTVREPSLYHIRFVRDLPEDGTCNPGQLEWDLWRCYLEPNVLYTFSQDEQTVHVLNFIALPDTTDHPDNPFGQIRSIEVA